MKKFPISLLFLVFTQNTFAQTLKWVKQIGASGRADYGNAIVADASGNTYVTGSFNGTTNFGGTSLTAYAIDIYIAKYNNAGTLQWVKQAGGSGAFNAGYGIAVDGSGNVYVTGYFAAATDFGGTSLTPIGYNDLFVAKYNSTGSLQWVKQAGAAGKYANGNGIAVNGSGNICITGYFQGAVDFGGTTLTALGSKDIFVASYNSAGTLVWVKQGGSAGKENIGKGISTDATGNVYVTGYFQSTTNFGGVTLTAIGFQDLFVASYNSAGTPNWVRQAGHASVQNNGYTTSYSALGTAIAADGLGNMFVTGKYYGPTDFGGTTLPAGAGQDVFIAKYSSVGDVSWAKQIGALGLHNFSYGIAADGSGYCYLTGEFGESANFGGTTLTAIGTRDVYVAKYNSAAGTLQWVKQAGAVNKFAIGSGITTDNTTIYTTGYFSGTTDFGGTSLSLIGTQDAFIWALQQSSCPNTLTPTGTITTNQKAATTVITVAGTSTANTLNIIPNGANVIYQAGSYVQLNPGFVTNSNAVFKATIIAGCN